jgi:hypothetical protein
MKHEDRKKKLSEYRELMGQLNEEDDSEDRPPPKAPKPWDERAHLMI